MLRKCAIVNEYIKALQSANLLKSTESLDCQGSPRFRNSLTYVSKLTSLPSKASNKGLRLLLAARGSRAHAGARAARRSPDLGQIRRPCPADPEPMAMTLRPAAAIGDQAGHTRRPRGPSRPLIIHRGLQLLPASRGSRAPCRSSGGAEVIHIEGRR